MFLALVKLNKTLGAWFIRMDELEGYNHYFVKQIVQNILIKLANAHLNEDKPIIQAH